MLQAAQPLGFEGKWLFSLYGAALQWKLSQPWLCNGKGPRDRSDELGSAPGREAGTWLVVGPGQPQEQNSGLKTNFFFM